MRLRAPPVTEGDRVLKGTTAKILGVLPCVKAARAEVNGVGSAAEGGNKLLPAACGRKYFGRRHMLAS